jgi:hypothetical protein
MDYDKLYPPYRAPPTYQNPPWFVDHDERYAPVPGWGTNLQLAAPRGRIGVSGYGAFGLDVPYVDPSGAAQIANADATQPMCSAGGDMHAMQQMLKDLGFYAGPIDGAASAASLTATTAAVSAFVASVPALAALQAAQTASTAGDTTACTALIAAWQAKIAANQAAATQKTVLVVAGIAAAGALGYYLWKRHR